MEAAEVLDLKHDLSVAREPGDVLKEAQKAAAALKDVISKKPRPIIMNGEQYLEFEDWQTVAKFYGVAAKVVETRPVELGEVRGFEARAVALLVSTGQEISAAEAMCLNDERNWQDKPFFQLRSMAQTRACAKALRNVLAWVVVLAGYRPTPAEEVTAEESGKELTPAQRSLKEAILNFTRGDEASAKSILETLTTWRDSRGYEHRGKRHVSECSDKMCQVALERLEKEFLGGPGLED